MEDLSTAGHAGKTYRMGRIFGADGRTLVLPLDHGTMLGRVSGLEDPLAAIRRFISFRCDGFLLGPGVTARSASLFAGRGAPARILTLDSYWKGREVGVSSMIATAQRAAALGVDGVKMLMPWNVGASERAAVVALLAALVEAADPLGLPVMAEPIAYEAPRGPEAVSVEADGCRVAVELGVDIVKVAYPGDPGTFGEWCAELHVPVVVLGGPGGEGSGEIVSEVAQAMAAGASGAIVGRRVWQRPPEEAERVLEELHAVVHRSSGAV